MKKIGKFSFVDTAAGQYALHMDWSSSMSQLFPAHGLEQLDVATVRPRRAELGR